MKKINMLLAAGAILIAAACTDMNPEVKFDPKADAEAFCAIGKKDSKVASEFWDKVEAAYIDKMMFDELARFEEMIIEASQAAAQEYPVRVAARSAETRDGEVSYYPDQDAQTYLHMLSSNPEGAASFFNQVIELYNSDGLYEDLEIFLGLCSTEVK
jgi:predicted lipoprotein